MNEECGHKYKFDYTFPHDGTTYCVMCLRLHCEIDEFYEFMDTVEGEFE